MSDDVAKSGDSHQRLILRRGSQELVVFRGSPTRATTRSLRRSGAMIGLALSSDELNATAAIDTYDYGFITFRAHTDSALESAIVDLARNNWKRHTQDRQPTDSRSGECAHDAGQRASSNSSKEKS